MGAVLARADCYLLLTGHFLILPSSLQSATRHFRQSFHCLPVNYFWPPTPPFLTSCAVLSIMAYFSVVGFSHLTVRWVELFAFIHFLGRLLCLYDKSLNTANLSSVNGGKGWRKQKKPGYTTISRDERIAIIQDRSLRKESLWLQAPLGYLMHPSSTQLHTIKTLSQTNNKQTQCSNNSISLLFKWASEKHNFICFIFGGICSQIINENLHVKDRKLYFKNSILSASQDRAPRVLRMAAPCWGQPQGFSSTTVPAPLTQWMKLNWVWMSLFLNAILIGVKALQYWPRIF